MGLDISWQTVLFFVVGIALLYGLGWVLLMPVRRVMKFVLNSILGGLLLLIVNIFSASLGFTIAVNPITCLVVGFLGIPGVLLLAGISWLL